MNEWLAITGFARGGIAGSISSGRYGYGKLFQKDRAAISAAANAGHQHLPGSWAKRRVRVVLLMDIGKSFLWPCSLPRWAGIVAVWLLRRGGKGATKCYGHLTAFEDKTTTKAKELGTKTPKTVLDCFDLHEHGCPVIEEVKDVNVLKNLTSYLYLCCAKMAKTPSLMITCEFLVFFVSALFHHGSFRVENKARPETRPLQTQRRRPGPAPKRQTSSCARAKACERVSNGLFKHGLQTLALRPPNCRTSTAYRWKTGQVRARKRAQHPRGGPLQIDSSREQIADAAHVYTSNARNISTTVRPADYQTSFTPPSSSIFVIDVLQRHVPTVSRPTHPNFSEP
ncbi:hypothetical protein FQR65_LT19300 [Abscondita terminalis]|nr:hypothetical protein FQR65_LT19300 [Abscondita terminalis]